MGSINKSHNQTDGGILLFNGELILLYCDSVQCEIGGKESFKGRVYLTTHRLVVIIAKYRQDAPVKSLCAPFCAIVKCNVEQPIFGANYIEATVRDENDSSLSFSFKLKFSKGGAIELAMAMNRAVSMVGRTFNPSMPPPPAYTPGPSEQYYQAPPTVYAPGYNCGVQMPLQQFPDQPPIGFIYASSAPPPYPGLNTQGGAPAGYPQQQGYPQAGGYPTQNPYPAPGGGYPGGQQTAGYPGAQQPSGYPAAQPPTGYPTAQPPAGYPTAQPSAGYPTAQGPAGPPAGYPGQQQQPAGYPQQPPQSGYPTQGYPATAYPAAQPGAAYPTQPPSGPINPSGSAGYPDLSQSSAPTEPSNAQGSAWPSAPSFNPNWQEDKKTN